MPQVIITAGAARGLESCRRFLAEKSPEAARRAGQAISRQFRLLQDAPAIGRPLPEEPDCGRWSSALGIPAMWRCTATSRMRVPFTYWPSGTRKKPGIERDHGSVLTTTPAARRRGGDSRCSEDAATRKQFATRCSGSFGKPSQKSEKPFEARRQTIFASQLIRNFGFWVSISIALV